MAIATSAALSLAASAASTGLAVYGQRQAAQSAEEAGEYNARIAENEADRRELESHETAKRQRMEKRRAKAQAFAQLAARGAALGEGSASDVMEVLDSRLESQIQDSARSAELEARAIRQQGNLAKFQAEQQSGTLKMQSYGTLLGGGSSFGGQYVRAKNRFKPTSLG